MFSSKDNSGSGYGSGNKKDHIKLEMINLTQLQMPMKPSPFDRKLGVKLGMRCGQYFVGDQNNNNNNNANVVMITSPMLDLVPIYYQKQ